MKVRLVRTAAEADEIEALAKASARKALEQLAQLAQLGRVDPLVAFWRMKTEGLGCDPLDAETPLNLIEQLNQTFTYIASARAVKILLSERSDLAPFTLNLGTSPGSDIEAASSASLAAEVFAAVLPGNNQKLRNDIEKVRRTAAASKYVFFMCPGYREGRQPQFERHGVVVWSVGAVA